LTLNKSKAVEGIKKTKQKQFIYKNNFNHLFNLI